MNAAWRRAATSLLGGAVILAGSGFGCRREEAPGATRRHEGGSPGVITIGMETWPGYLPLIVASEKGYFRDEGLNVRIKRYTALGELSKDYVAGKMQARANLTFDAVHERLQGLDHRAVMVIDYSNGADAIAARAGIKRVGDFVGKRVGYEPDTLEEFFLSWALSQYGLSLKDVVSVPGNPEETGKMLEAGRIDVAVTHEPYLSKVIQTGKAHVVYPSSRAPGLITDVLTFRADFIKEHPRGVEGVLRAHFRALDFWKRHPREACAIVAGEFGETPEGIHAAMSGITMLDLSENRIAFSYAAGLGSLYGNLRKVGEFVQAHRGGAGARPLDTDESVEPRFVRALLRESARDAGGE